jgi:hypothetical protein
VRGGEGAERALEERLAIAEAVAAQKEESGQERRFVSKRGRGVVRVPDRACADKAQAERLLVLKVDPDVAPRALAFDPEVDARLAPRFGGPVACSVGVGPIGREEGCGGGRGERTEGDFGRGRIERGERVAEP